MKDKNLILFLILLICFVNILQANKINNLESQVAQQEQTIVELQENVLGLGEIVTELNIIVKWKEQYTNIPLHKNESSFKSYMDYRTITNETSNQYQLIYSDSIAVGNDGLLYSGEYVGVALGSKFGNIGDRFLITLNNGKQFRAIKVDEKDDSHTIDNCHHANDGSIIEFVIDIDLVKQSYPMAITMGDFDYIDKFNGKVVRIEREVQQ